MRQYLVAALLAASALITSTHAQAQAATQDINLDATVAQYCFIDNSATGTVINETIPIDLLGDVDTSVISNSVANVTCNSAATVGIESLQGGVVNLTPAPVGFSNVIDYEASATLGTATATIDTAFSSTDSQDTTAAVSGTLVIEITPTLNTTPLVAGTYNDVLRVTLTPL